MPDAKAGRLSASERGRRKTGNSLFQVPDAHCYNISVQICPKKLLSKFVHLSNSATGKNKININLKVTFVDIEDINNYLPGIYST